MTAIATRLGVAALLLLAVTPFAAAQDGAGSSVPLPLLPGGTATDVDILRRLTAQLGGGTGAPNLSELSKLIERFGKGGKVDEKGLTEQLKKLSQGDQKKLLDDLLKPFGGKLPPGMKLPDGLKPPELPQPGPQPRPDEPFKPQPGGPNPNGGFRPPPASLPPGFPNGPPGMQLPNSGSAKDAIEFWEKNVGSLNQMPAVRDALIALATSGMDGSTGKPFWEDMMKDLTADGGGGSSSGGFFKWLNANTSNWTLPSGGGGSGWNPPGSGWSGSSGRGGFGPPSAEGLGAVGIVFLAIIGAAVVGLFFWKVLPVIREGRTPRPLPGQGPWPVDPRAIRTREQLVMAFEYISVLECGDRARTWNHVTIADGLRTAVPASASYADALARLYAVARYTPEAEPLSDATVGEARAYLCRLAGVSAA